MSEVKLKRAIEFWEERYGEKPKTDSEILAVAMMAMYGEYITMELAKIY